MGSLLLPLKDGRRLWISEHGSFEISDSPETYGNFEDVDADILVIVNETIVFDDDRPAVTYDSGEWVQRVCQYLGVTLAEPWPPS